MDKNVLVFILICVVILLAIIGCVFLSVYLDKQEFNNGVCATCGADLLPVDRGNYHSNDLDWYCQKCHKFQ